MSTPVLHLLAGPNGSGKTTFHDLVLGPATFLPFVNADQIAALRWPHDPLSHGHEASREASRLRTQLIAERKSFVTETVFSHPSKVELLRHAASAGYQVTLDVMLVPVELAVVQVTLRVKAGGHDVPEAKIRARYQRLWAHIVAAVGLADHACLYDNTSAEHPYRIVARYEHGRRVGSVEWPAWAPAELHGIAGA
jgi:predicted ABC-type ATPase